MPARGVAGGCIEREVIVTTPSDSSTPSPRRLFTECTMGEPDVMDVPGGQAAVFSARNPVAERPNQDAALVRSLGDKGAVLAVADGAGGHADGAQASRVALEALDAQLQSDDLEDWRAAILDGLEHADEAVQSLGVGAATTLVAAAVRGDIVRPYHVGDSVLLVLGSRGRVKYQTIAHSPTGYAVESGLLDEEEAMHHAERHLVSNMVGLDEMRIDIGPPLPLSARDTVLLASDGLFDNLSVAEIVDLARRGTLGEAAEALAREASGRMTLGTEEREILPSKPDDLSFILFRRDST